MRLRLSLFATAITAALMLTACGGESSQVASERFTRGIGSQPKSIDPQKVEGTWANDVLGDMFIGLFTEDAKSIPVPGVAESWVVSEDGLTWTFKLKKTLWSDDVPLTAGDFVFTFQRLFDPKEAEIAYASIQYGIKNGRAAKEGAVPVTDVGVKAIDGGMRRIVSFVWSDIRKIQAMGKRKKTRTSVIATLRRIFSRLDEWSIVNALRGRVRAASATA